MKVTVSELLDRVRAQIGAKNDRQMGLSMGWHSAQITQWRNGAKFPEDDTLTTMYVTAGFTEKDAAEAICRHRAALSKGPARKVYELLLKNVAALAVSTFILLGSTMGAKAELLNSSVQIDCILWKILDMRFYSGG
jgi:hypothetical protein